MTKAIAITTSKFERSHGRQPKGTGAWGFIVIDDSCDKEVALFFVPAMTLTAAKAWAKAYVCKNFADEVATGYLSLEVAP
jgi:hypothetical protein